MLKSESPALHRLQELSKGIVKANASRTDEEGKWPEENIRAIQQAGLGGLVLPRELGGLGEGLLTMARACEILGRHCASTSMCYGMHLVGSLVLSSKATDFHRENFLRPIAEGKHWTTLALSEPGTGSHFYVPQTTIQEKGDTLIINGKKSFVTNGSHADSYVVSVVHGSEDLVSGKFSCVVIPGNSPELRWEGRWNGLGMRANSSCAVSINDLRVPQSHLLGEIGDQLWYVFEVIAPTFLVAMSGTYLGIAEAALQEATEHLKQRSYSHTGDPLGSIQVLQHKLGHLWARVETTRQLVYSAATKGDAGDESAILSIMSAKAEVADCVVNVVNESMTLMGGKGYGHAGEMERHLRDARAAHVMAPTTDILRVWTGRALLGLPLLGD